MSEQIKKSDVSEKDVFGWIIESAKIAEEQIEAMNQQLSISAKLSKEALKGKGTSDVSSLKAVEQAVASTNNLLKQKLKLEADLISIQAKKTNAETQLTKAIERSNREEQKKIAQQEKLTSSYSRVDKWLRDLSKEYRELAIRQELSGKLSEAEIKRMTTLEGRIKTYDSALKQVDATMGKHQRNVGNYSSAYNGLGNSVNQLTREMPAFANSLQTGFMAISNNLPIFFDEISKINKANKELVAQGQPIKSVFSQLAGAIFSFGTVLSVGVTLLTIYGKQIVEFIIGTESAADAQERLNKATEKGNEEAEKTLNILQRKLDWDKITTKQAIESLKIEIGKARAKKEQAKQDALVIKGIIDNIKQIDKLNTTNLIKEQAGKKAFKFKQDEVRQQEAYIIKLKEELYQLELGEYQKSKSTKIIKNKTKEVKNATDALKEYNKEEEDFINKTKSLYDELITGMINSNEYVNNLIIGEEEKEIKNVNAKYRRLFDLAELFGEDTKDLEIARLNEINDIRTKYAKKEIDDAKELDDTMTFLEKERIIENKKFWKEQEELNKQRYENYKEWTDLITEYFIKKSNQRIEQLDKESQNAQKNYDLLVELAKNGNIQAQQSLAQEQKNLIEANKKKEQELKKQELIKLSGTAIDTFATKLANNDKTPLLSTIKDITLLKAFISSLASFDVGSERTFADGGNGIDGKGGRMAIVHPNEKIFTEEHSKKIGFDISNNEVANIISLYKQGTLVPLNKVGAFAGTSYDLKPLLKEVQELKDVIKNQPIPNLEVGRITRDLYEFGQRTVKGNTTTIDKYQIRKR